ncbi:hypothetical protein WN944_026607 [Citrus x changshan-huyou]|uniref:Uncharacterized protein n=1 Tax=Citrus x changshan-huyou TaxID=2935761 RepID=A0AAP0QEQ5_9ROSI
MGSNVMGLGGGALAATIIVMILFFAANDQSCADAAAGVNKSNRTNMANFHFDHNDMLFSEDDSELQLAAAVPRTTTLNVGIAAKQVIDCARPGPYKPCTPDPQNSKKGEHCSPPPGGLYLNRGCAY